MTENSLLEDFSSLFDLGTVLDQDGYHQHSISRTTSFSSSKSYRTRIKSEIVTIPRIVLTPDDTVQVIDDEFLSYYEEVIPIPSSTTTPPRPATTGVFSSKLRLNISRGCGRDIRDTDHYVVPSLRLNYIDNKEYIEPIRDRDKCWTLDSQRPILNGDQEKQEGLKLKLGQHKPLDHFPPLVWCPPLQTSLRKRSLLRMSAVISDTHCFVNIYGLGVAGRIAAPGGTTNRMLLIEAYSVWNSTIYSLPIHIPHLKTLLRGREELLIPGRKKDLLKALIPLLYFDYEVVYPLPLDDPSSGVSDLQESKSILAENSQSKPETTESEIEPSIQCDENTSKSIQSQSQSVSDIHHSQEKVVYIHHLDKFTLPAGYPQSIADIIRAMTTPSDLLDTFVPSKLNQILKISPMIRENGPVVRRRDIEEIHRLEKLEEERKRKIWQDTPRRFKGLMSGKCIRKYGKFVIVSSYRMPLKPTVMSIKGHVFNECQKVGHFLDLGSIGQANGIALNPRKWDDSLAKLLCQRATRHITTGESTRSTLYLQYQHKTGSEVQLSYPPSCAGFHYRRSVTKERDRLMPSRFSFYVPDHPLHHPIDSYYVPSNSCLGEKSMRRKRLYPGDPICGSCQPRRDINRPQRLLSRGKKIGHMYGIYTLYQTGKLSEEPLLSIKDIEENIKAKHYGNEVLPHFLGPFIELQIEIYFTENPTVVALRNGLLSSSSSSPSSSPESEFGTKVENSPTILQISLHRGDLCRLITNKYLLRLAFRIGHQEFKKFADFHEVELVENSWSEIGNILLNLCRWRRTNEGMSFGKGYYNKLYQATNLLSIESINITTQRLEKNSKKMKVSQPIMRAAVNTSSTTTTAFLKRQASMISKDYDLLCNSKAELVLILSTILYSQTCQVMSLSSHRPNVILQVFIWQKGINFGVVCYDKIKQDIYMIQPTQVEQETITIPLQAADVEEIAINMSLYATSLTYQEETQKDGTIRGFITLEASEEVDMTAEF